MKKILSCLTMALCGIAGIAAQDRPAITIHTSIYDGYGDINAFSLVIGGSEPGYIDVDCGFGPVEYELQQATFDSSSQSVKGTIVNCHVNEDGIVKIYCDEPARIEYFDGLGGFIRQIEFEHPEDLTVLNLEHNELESLDLSRMTNLQALYVSDNPFNKEPFNIAVDMPYLQILEMSIVENISPDFSFRHFPSLVSVDAMSTYGLTDADVTRCPNLIRFSVDNTNISSIDVSNNPQLRILNVSDTRVRELDLSHNPKMEQLYATHHSAMNSEYKLHTLSLRDNPDMIYLFLSGNALTTLDCSGMSKLRELVVSHNKLTSINLDGCESLVNVDIQDNCLDFNTLPVNPGYWSDYIGKQSDFSMPRSIAVGDVIDLKSRVIRSDSSTTASVFSVSRNNPAVAVPVSEDKWTFDDGRITFTDAVADSVFVEFSNPTFLDFGLQTARFKVKTADEMVKPSFAFSFNPIYLGMGDNVTFGVGIDGASPENPKQVHVDFGDRNLRTYQVTACNGDVTTISDVKPSYGAVKVYVDNDDVVTDITIENIYSSDVNLTNVEELRHLTLRNLKLYDIDLKWNRSLQSLVLTGNHFSYGFDLKGANGWYGKNVLSHLNLSDNELSAVEFNDVFMLRHLDLSHNNIEEFSFKDADMLEYIDMSHNKLTEAVINYCSSLREAHFDHNQITSIRMPETNIVEKFTVNDNKLTLVTLPEHGLMTEENYIYAPQAEIPIPAKGPGHNLNGQYIEIGGETTVYTWKTTAGDTLVEGVDYTIDKGVTTFLDPTLGKDLYCEISHPAFPAFEGDNVLKTTVINSAGMPTNCLATFMTPVGGEQVRLSMTALRPATTIYIDWSGKNELTQYIITNESYTVFEAETVEGAEVKVYSYSNVSNLSVFSISNATMESIDASGMKQLTMFGVNNAGLSADKIVFPPVSKLRELSLEGNEITSFDLSAFTRLGSCSLSRNKLTELIVPSTVTDLEVLTVDRNKLESVTFEGNNKLWGLSLTGNKLESIDFHNIPALYQVFLDDNLLSDIDLDYLSDLHVVSISGNRFDFSNLPLPRESWVVYNYGNQPEIHIEDGNVVDLSHLASREGYETVFTWYYGMPSIDTGTGEITGEELYVDDEYTISNGITTFLTDIDRACCVLTNPLFPNMYLITNMIHGKMLDSVSAVDADKRMHVATSGLDIIVSGLENGTPVTLASADGRTVTTAVVSDGSVAFKAPAAGFYIVSSPNGSVKTVVRF